MDKAQLNATLGILSAAWQGGFTVKSTLAREAAQEVAMAVERGLITNRIGPSLYTKTYLITPTGLQVLWSLRGLT